MRRCSTGTGTRSTASTQLARLRSSACSRRLRSEAALSPGSRAVGLGSAGWQAPLLGGGGWVTLKSLLTGNTSMTSPCHCSRRKKRRKNSAQLAKPRCPFASRPNAPKRPRPRLEEEAVHTLAGGHTRTSWGGGGGVLVFCFSPNLVTSCACCCRRFLCVYTRARANLRDLLRWQRATRRRC